MKKRYLNMINIVEDSFDKSFRAGAKQGHGKYIVNYNLKSIYGISYEEIQRLKNILNKEEFVEDCEIEGTDKLVNAYTIIINE